MNSITSSGVERQQVTAVGIDCSSSGDRIGFPIVISRKAWTPCSCTARCTESCHLTVPVICSLRSARAASTSAEYSCADRFAMTGASTDADRGVSFRTSANFSCAGRMMSQWNGAATGSDLALLMTLLSLQWRTTSSTSSPPPLTVSWKGELIVAILHVPTLTADEGSALSSSMICWTSCSSMGPSRLPVFFRIIPTIAQGLEPSLVREKSARAVLMSSPLASTSCLPSAKENAFVKASALYSPREWPRATETGMRGFFEATSTARPCLKACAIAMEKVNCTGWTIRVSRMVLSPCFAISSCIQSSPANTESCSSCAGQGTPSSPTVSGLPYSLKLDRSSSRSCVGIARSSL
mmetsp:Transcript_11196/g.45555  ORF Transcript_11196/g.45555 Transcript_11196/m.45555 type:complete len:352 (+) Transcript_11196:1379-2434(+)